MQVVNNTKGRVSYTLLFCSLWCICPPLFVNPMCRILALICMLILLLSQRSTQSSFKIVFAFAMLIYISIGMLTVGSSFVVQQIQMLVVYCFAYIAVEGQHNYARMYNRRTIERAIMVAYPIFMFLTLRAYTLNPRISRMLVNNSNVDVTAYSYQGVGGYGMIYSLVFYNILCLYLIRYRKERNFLLIVNYVLSLLTVIQAGYSIALIALIIGSVVVLAVGNQNQIGTRAFFVLISALLGYLVFIIAKEAIINIVTDLVQGTLYERKWADIVASLQGGAAFGSFEDRQVLYEYSLQNFLAHPVLGTWVTGSFIFGGHSLILDTFARFGLVGGVPLIGILLYYPLKCIRARYCLGLSVAMLIEILFIGMFNNLAAAIAPILYLLYPIAVEEYVDDNYLYD